MIIILSFTFELREAYVVFRFLMITEGILIMCFILDGSAGQNCVHI